jgi:SAM-dependent methyltransferase
MVQCPLCFSTSSLFSTFRQKEYYHCPHCKAIFVGAQFLPTPHDEAERYKKHQNNIDDEGYLAFTAPLFRAITQWFTPAHRGLDYGSGTTSAISHSLVTARYQVQLYDPFFNDHKLLLEETYDYIICCEVIEHFHEPAKEFRQLSKMIKPDGKLFCMTSLFNHDMDFDSWYYKNDFTHVVFYTEATLQFICGTFGFKGLKTEKNLHIFSK